MGVCEHVAGQVTSRANACPPRQTIHLLHILQIVTWDRCHTQDACAKLYWHTKRVSQWPQPVNGHSDPLGTAQRTQLTHAHTVCNMCLYHHNVGLAHTNSLRACSRQAIHSHKHRVPPPTPPAQRTHVVHFIIALDLLEHQAAADVLKHAVPSCR